MSLNLPSKPEVRLENSPLDEVICQIKIPPILRISKDIPIEFQDSIRDRFPGLQVEQGVLVQFPRIGSTEEPAVETPPKIHRFLSSDESMHVALAPDFFSLSTRRYTHWGDFLGDFGNVEQAFRTIYRPSYAKRIGLRFINRFTFENTSTKTLDELLGMFRTEFVCLVRSDAWNEPDEMLTKIVVSDEEAKLALRSAYGVENQSPYFVLDFDYYVDGILELDGLVERIDNYHNRIYDAFRWCLKDKSLQRFGPQPS